MPPASAHEEEKDDEDDGKRRASKKGGKGEKGEKGAEALKEEPKPEVMVDLDGFIYMLLKNRSGGQKAWWKGWLQKKTKEVRLHPFQSRVQRRKTAAAAPPPPARRPHAEVPLLFSGVGCRVSKCRVVASSLP